MYIETSRPRKEGDKARLLSPTFNVAPKNPYGITNPPAYCFGFYYHMYGKHIGKSNPSSLLYNATVTGLSNVCLTTEKVAKWITPKTHILWQAFEAFPHDCTINVTSCWTGQFLSASGMPCNEENSSTFFSRCAWPKSLRITSLEPILSHVQKHSRRVRFQIEL